MDAPIWYTMALLLSELPESLVNLISKFQYISHFALRYSPAKEVACFTISFAPYVPLLPAHYWTW